jgi:LPPG:FO 2-phospho-L-lactate transferase
MGTVVALAGQFGGAKLADGLRRLRASKLTVVVNTGDDYEHLGLSFAPDLDTVLYTLSGLASAESGWEPAQDSSALHAMVKRLGGPDRPRVGDKALAAPLLRGDALRNGKRLTEITRGFSERLGIEAHVLPMTDDPVRTHVLTEEGAIPFPEYFMEHGCEPRVTGFQYAGADEARIPDEVIGALHSDELEAVVLCPANPFHTLGPILALPGMRELLRKRGAPVIAVTPIIGGKALQGFAGKVMRELGREVSARSVALEYRKLIDGFVIDAVDEELADGILASGIEVLMSHTVMRSIEDRVTLARNVLDFAQAIRARREVEA